jgi:UDP-N-acetyl-D-glucosamine/UDP-N-acetyl-D-galactosamine dehydrogenase
MIESGRFINDSMGGYVAKQLVKKIIAQDKNIKNSRVLIMGFTFKEDVSDIRNSKVIDVYNELISYGVNVDVVDPYADNEEVKDEYGFELLNNPRIKYDAIILAVGHKEYKLLNEDDFIKLTSDNAIFVDIKGIFKNKISKLNYWSL